MSCRGHQQRTAFDAWLRLEHARRAYDADIRRRFGVSALQLGILHVLNGVPSIGMHRLLRMLGLHAATGGQAIAALVEAGLCWRGHAPSDRRGWLLAPTDKGRQLAARAPLAGPLRLRHLSDTERAARLAAALDDAVQLLALEDWAPPA